MAKNRQKSQTNALNTPSKEKLAKLSEEIFRTQDQLKNLGISYKRDLSAICGNSFDWAVEAEFVTLFADFSAPIYIHLFVYYLAESRMAVDKVELGVQLMQKARTFLANEMTNEQKTAALQALKQFKMRKFREKELVIYLYSAKVEYFLLKNLQNPDAWEYFLALPVVVLNNFERMIYVYAKLMRFLLADNEQTQRTVVDLFLPQNFQRPDVQAYLATEPHAQDVILAFEKSFNQEAMRHLLAQEVVLVSGYFEQAEILDTIAKNRLPHWNAISQLILASQKADTQIVSQYLQQLESFIVEDEPAEKPKLNQDFALFLWLALRGELPIRPAEIRFSVLMNLKTIEIMNIMARFMVQEAMTQAQDDGSIA
jgi:hypothetical protein